MSDVESSDQDNSTVEGAMAKISTEESSDNDVSPVEGAAAKMSPTIVKLESSDGDIFPVHVSVAKVSETIKTMLEDLGVAGDDEEPVPLTNVSSAILIKVMEWCEFHKNDPPPPEENELKPKSTDNIIPWDRNFLHVDQDVLLELIEASNYLNIQGLMDVSCKRVAHIMKDMTVEEIRKHFNIENDLEPELEAQIIAENSWCDDL